MSVIASVRLRARACRIVGEARRARQTPRRDYISGHNRYNRHGTANLLSSPSHRPMAVRATATMVASPPSTGTPRSMNTSNDGLQSQQQQLRQRRPKEQAGTVCACGYLASSRTIFLGLGKMHLGLTAIHHVRCESPEQDSPASQKQRVVTGIYRIICTTSLLISKTAS
eukprot:COSAG05_NODE_107_length_18696_cov_209.227766_5_plen_169_part_00